MMNDNIIATVRRRTELIARHYGFDHQAEKTIEELNELIEALNSYSVGDDTIEHLQEEIADVKVMITQIEYILDLNTSKTYAIMDAKAKRQLERIEAERLARSDGE